VNQSLDNLKNTAEFQLNSTLFEEINFETLQDQKIKQISKV